MKDNIDNYFDDLFKSKYDECLFPGSRCYDSTIIRLCSDNMPCINIKRANVSND